MRLTRKSKMILAGIATLAITGGTAFAYWTQGGTGTGTAAAGSTIDIVVTQTSPAISNLYPGGPSASLSGKFNNPNPGSVNIVSVTAAVTSVSPSACAASNFIIAGTSGATTVPSGTAVGSWNGLTIQLNETGVNQDICKDAIATITYTANPL